MGKKTENLVDEGLRVSLVETACFDGDLEIPHIHAPNKIFHGLANKARFISFPDWTTRMKKAV